MYPFLLINLLWISNLELQWVKNAQCHIIYFLVLTTAAHWWVTCHQNTVFKSIFGVVDDSWRLWWDLTDCGDSSKLSYYWVYLKKTCHNIYKNISDFLVWVNNCFSSWFYVRECSNWYFAWKEYIVTAMIKSCISDLVKMKCFPFLLLESQILYWQNFCMSICKDVQLMEPFNLHDL